MATLWGKQTFAEAFPEAAKVRRLADAIPDDECPHYLKRSSPGRTNLSGLWQAQVELSARLMEAQRIGCHVPPASSLGGDDHAPGIQLGRDLDRRRGKGPGS